MALLAALWASAAPGAAERPEDRWNLADLYPSVNAWADDAARLEAQLKEFAVCRGQLGDSARRLKYARQQRREHRRRLCPVEGGGGLDPPDSRQRGHALADAQAGRRQGSEALPIGLYRIPGSGEPRRPQEGFRRVLWHLEAVRAHFRRHLPREPEEGRDLHQAAQVPGHPLARTRSRTDSRRHLRDPDRGD